MKYFFFVFVSLVTTFSCLAQKKESLIDLPYKSIRDTINAYMHSDEERAVIASEAYILKAQQENDKENEWLGMESLAFNYVSNRDYKRANEQGLTLLNFARTHSLPNLEMRSLVFLGDLQMVVGTADGQLQYYNDLLSLAEQHGNTKYREGALNKIASLLDLSGETNKAVAIRKKTIRYYQEKELDSSYTQKDKNSALLYAYNLLASSYLNAEKVDSAKVYSAYIKEFLNQELDSCYATFHYMLQAEIAFSEERFVAARKNFNKGFDVCPSDYDIIALNKAYAFGKVEVGAENYNEAIRILQQGLDSYQVTAAEEGFMRDYYERLAEAYKHTGDFEKASYYFEKYLTTQDQFNKLIDETKKVMIDDERAAFKKEFDSLKAEKEKNQNYLTYVFLGASIIILILLLLLLKFYRNKRQNEAKFEALLAKIEAAKAPEDIINSKDEILEEKTSQDVSEEIKTEILTGLKKLEKREYFLQQECNSYNVAKKIGTNTTYLSKVINSHYGKNFNTYINDLRINYAIVRIKNDVLFRSYSIQSIAEEIGYKSADSFTKYFKKDTGLNPSFYIRNIKNLT